MKRDDRAFQLAWQIVNALRLAELPAGREARKIIERHIEQLICHPGWYDGPCENSE